MFARLLVCGLHCRPVLVQLRAPWPLSSARAVTDPGCLRFSESPARVHLVRLPFLLLCRFSSRRISDVLGQFEGALFIARAVRHIIGCFL